MQSELPPLTTFGAPIRFAASLEEEAARRYRAYAEARAARAAVHDRRAAQLRRLVQEQLNEMTLEPISGLRAEDYAFPDESPPAEIERRLALLYEHMAARAGPALGGATRTLARFAQESRAMSQEG